MFGLGDTIEEISKQVLLMSHDSVLIFDQSFQVIFANEATERLFGYTPKELVGMNLNVFIPERFHMQHDVFTDEFSRDDIRAKYMGDRTRKIYAQHSDGHEFLVDVTIMRPKFRKPAYVAIIRDQRAVSDDETEILRLASTDPLTGALNKKEFLTVAEKESLRAKRYSRPFTVGMISIDTMDDIHNDHGYSAGDRALQWVTNLCCNTLRNVDIFARWSDTEFSVLLPETPIDGGETISRRLVRLIADDHFEWQDKEVKLTISVGITAYDDRKTSLEEAMHYAALALKEAQEKGGNDIVTNMGA